MSREAFTLAFERNGKLMPVQRLVLDSVGGLVFEGESSALPVGFGLRLEPTSPGTKFRWENIQRDEGWIDTRTFKLLASVQDGRLRLQGIRNGKLPEGNYRANVFVTGFEFEHRWHDFTIPRDGVALVRLDDKADQRRLELSGTVNELDEEILRIAKASTVDGAPMTEWLANSEVRACRRACALNVLAKLRAPIAGNAPLSAGIVRVINVNPDRLYVELEPRFAGRFVTEASGFRQDKGSIHNTHKRLLTHIPVSGEHGLVSFRERVEQLSLQMTIALPSDPDAPQWADVDIDMANPFVSPKGFVFHIGELIDTSLTDHLDVCGRLRGTGCKDFMLHSVRIGQSTA